MYRPPSEDRLRSLTDNVSAVSAVFHESTKDYAPFYEKHGPRHGGFPGIWRYCADCAEQFTNAEEVLGIEWDGEWIDAIDAFVAVLLADQPCARPQDILPIVAKIVEELSVTCKHPQSPVPRGTKRKGRS